MHTPIDSRLIDEARRYSLRYGCPDCVHHEARTQQCSLGFPNQAHLDVKLESERQLSFCKTFELG
jgi:hypothetical protein